MIQKTSLKIAQVTNCYESVPPINKGGLEQMVHYLTESLSTLGHEITLFGTADSQTSATIFPVWPCAVSRNPASQVREIGWYETLSLSAAFEHSDEIDIIHDHSYFLSGMFSSLSPKPIVSTMHHPVEFEKGLMFEFPEPYRSKVIDSMNERFAHVHIVVVSEFQQRQLHEVFNRPSTVIYNGIPEEEWQDYSTEPGDYLAFLGYLSGTKGVHEAIQAVLTTDEKLRIAGPVDDHDKDTHEYYNEKVLPYIDDDKITYVGALDSREKKEFLRGAKATLMPVQWDEPFGLVAIESLACGTPVIATHRGALPEIINHGETGYIANSLDEIPQLISSVTRLSRDACRTDFLKRFTAKRMAEDYSNLYYDILDRKAIVS